MNITVYDAKKVAAVAKSQNGSNWIDLQVTEVVNGRERESEITLFFDGPDAGAFTARLADAINAASSVTEAA